VSRAVIKKNRLLQLRRRVGLLVGNTIRSTGWEVRRLDRNPSQSLLGLRRHDIRTVVDVGANTGQFAREYLALFPRARVMSYEPLASAFEGLSQWAATEPRVTAFNVAVGDAEGKLQMYEHVHQNVSSSLLPVTQTSIDIWPAQAEQRRVDVRVATLDELLRGAPLDREVLVKLDVQGYEDRVIRGAGQTLRQATAAIVEVNLDTLYEGQARFTDIVAGLDAAGLQYAGSLDQVIYSDGHVIAFDALFLARSR